MTMKKTIIINGNRITKTIFPSTSIRVTLDRGINYDEHITFVRFINEK